MRFASRFGVLCALGIVALATTGCGETVIDDAKTEAALEQNLERSSGAKITSIECPSGVEVEKDATFQCSIELKGGGGETATLKILNEDADVAVTKLEPAADKEG